MMARQSYAHELANAMTFPAAMSLVEGGVVGTLANKLFDVSGLQFAAIMAAPMFANVTSFIWARLARGRRKVPFIVGLQIALLACVAGIAVLPVSMFGAGALTALVIASRCLLAGVVTLRSTVWRANYPARVRAQVTGKLALINSVVIATAPLIGFAFLDKNPYWFRWLYPVGVALSLAGVAAMSRVRLRHERDLLNYENKLGVAPTPHGAPGAPGAAIYEYDPLQTPTFWTVLRRDHLFRRYMFFQFLAGSSVMGSETVAAYLITKELTSGMNYAYAISILLTATLPLLIAIAVMPTWAHYLDRVHVTTFRSRQGGFWILSQLVYFLAAMVWVGAQSAIGALLILALGRMIQGVIRGGGMLAWNLGHNDFADRRMVALYMGIHVTLTGVRGALAPFLCMVLYLGWSSDALAILGVAYIPEFAGVGPYVFVLTACVATAATIGFTRMKRAMDKQNKVTS